MISRFSQFLVEEEKTVFFGFGRMNPPTIGHGKLLDVLSQKSGRNPYRMFLSQSQDKNKNPLVYKDKVKHARKMFPKHARSIMLNNKVRTALDALVILYNEGFVNVVMVVGSDRINEFNVLLNKYNGKNSRHGFYNFKSIKIISAGERDPDSEGAEGASATKQRQYAKDNNFTSFAQGLPAAMTNPDAKKLFNAVRKGMGLKEAKEFKNHIQLKPVSDIRESYLRDNIFKEGEQVVMTKHGIVGNIKYLGTNYLIVESKGETWRCWLDDVSKVDPNDIPPGHIEADYGADPEQGPYRNLSEANQPEWGTPESTAKAKKMTPGQLKKREKIAKDLPDADFKKRYGKDWMSVKMATATKMAKENAAQNAAIAISKQKSGNYDKDGNRIKPYADGRPASKHKFKKYDEATTTSQDKDIGDRKGTQPARYHKGLSKATKIARDRHFKKGSKMDDNDPRAYKQAPGDKTAKTKPSKYTKFVNKMMNREHNYASPEDRIDAHKKLKSKHAADGNTRLAKMYDTKIKRDQ